MNEKYPYIIETGEPVAVRKFPVAAQLGVLTLIMFTLFGSYFFKTDAVPEIELQAAIIEPNIEDAAVHLQGIDHDAVQVKAHSAYVWDIKTQRSLYSKNSSEELPLASITKLMTVLLAHELIESEKITTIPSDAIQQEGSSGLSAGEKLTINELRELALVSSSNDAAFALAASVGAKLGNKDPTTQFVRGMNIRADMLGLDTLEFWNTTGLDLSLTKPGSIGSAEDVSFLMEYIITEYPGILESTQHDTARIYNDSGAYHEANNTNPIIGDIPNLISSKTGFTDLAGGNLTIAFDAGLNRPIIITVLGSTYNERFTDVLTLVEAVQESISKQ